MANEKVVGRARSVRSSKNDSSLDHAQVPKVQTAEGWRRERLKEKKTRG